MTTATANTDTIVEQFSNGLFLSEAIIDGSSIRNVCLCGQKSKNNRTYLPSAFGDGSIYEGRPVMLDHNEFAPRSRSIRDFAGTVENVSIRDGKPYGDVKTANTDAGRTLLEIAKSSPRDVGMSHSASGSYQDSARTIVESLHEIHSVDAVMFPATTKNFSEQTLPGVDVEAIEDIDELRGILSQAITERDAAVAERDSMFSRLNSEVQEIEIYRECKEGGLDIHSAEQMSDLFLSTLRKTPTTELRRALVADRVRAFVAASRQQGGGTLVTRERDNGYTPRQSLRDEIDLAFGEPTNLPEGALREDIENSFGESAGKPSGSLRDEIELSFPA
ncbi:hypothetical protein Pan258_35200 [Symmachiella dynata]|uniref:hypothetical protein n=1 Tax=Symmachiella dynata TaxID=2527995 RepID=UPI00118A3603|nr:hypothetical protein [Symmachiella dynata]QDT49471.1 hypothetical protein Pan258_35200 [Symmachiella dynata]